MTKQHMFTQTAFTAFLILVTMFTPASADSTTSRYLAFQSFSLHFRNFDELNGINPTLGLEVSPRSGLGWQAGVFQDSFEQLSGYAGINYTFASYARGNLRARLLGVANLTYKQFHKNQAPEARLIPLPAIELKTIRQVYVNLSVVPEIGGKKYHTNGLIYLQFKLKL